MPKKLTALGVLTALVIGALGVFSNANAAIQHFDTSGQFEVDADICFGGSPPSIPLANVGTNPCGAGSSDSAVAAGATVNSYSVVRIPPGDRLSLGLSFLPTAGAPATGWTPDNPACGVTNATNDCQGGVVSSQVVGGDVIAEANLFCHGIHTSPSYNADILSIGPPTFLTAPPYHGAQFRRSAASVANGGTGEPVAPSPNAYIPQIVTFPTDPTLLHPFTFNALDTAALDNLWLGGSAPFSLTPNVPLQNASYNSGYVPGLVESVAILAGSPTPPDDQYLCTDSPQNSSATSVVTTPTTPGIYPRWAIYASAADIVDGTEDRIIDLQCVAVGAPVFTDADNDCLATPADTNDANPDQDGDKIPDGIEALLNAGASVTASCAAANLITSADCDNDKSNDFDEMFNLTNPKDADTDNDGSLDKQDNGEDESTCATCIHSVPSVPPAPVGATVASADDTTVDDNCPTVKQLTQTNTDATATFHGGVAADNTNPDADYDGDACDTDIDNDNIGNVAEVGLNIVSWTGFSGAAKTVCKSSGGTPPPTGTAGSVAVLPTNGDSDKDLILDGIECQMASRPDVSDPRCAVAAGCLTVPVTSGGPPGDGATCVKTTIDPKGCAQPDKPAAGGDQDSDGLYRPGFGVGDGGLVETFYRTQNIDVGIDVPMANDIEACPAGMCGVAACGPDGLIGSATDKDSDCDGLQDGVEVKTYGTSPANPDTDHDGCSDGREAADVNGDRSVTSGDLGSVAASFGSYLAADKSYTLNPTKVNKDFNKDGSITSGDLGAVAAQFGPCSGAFANQQQGNTPIPHMKVAPAN